MLTTKENKEHRRPMNVYVRRGSNDRVSEADGNLTEVFREVELTDNIGTVPVQFMYSNAVHGPEGPIAQANPPVNSLPRSVGSAWPVACVLSRVTSWTAPELSCAKQSR